jgi:hypothetical protein
MVSYFAVIKTRGLKQQDCLPGDAEELHLSRTDVIQRGRHRQKNSKSKKAIATAQHDMHTNTYDKTNIDFNIVQ